MDIVRRIEGLDHTIGQAFENFNTTLDAGELDLTTSRRFSQYVQRVKTQRKIQEAYLAEQEKVLNVVRLELQAHLVKKKSLELLREKHHKRFLKEVEQEEEKFLSEIALNRMAR